MKLSVQIFDFFIATILLFVLFIPCIIIAFIIKLTSEGPVFYKQLRIGHLEKPFQIYKFRTMKLNSDNNDGITIGDDNRITEIGTVLRKTKLDEIPQLINIFRGEMSFVGFRPDIPEYTEYYKKIDPNYFRMMPGITGKASIHLSNEEELMSSVDNPKKFYIEKIIPQKVAFNQYHLEKKGIFNNFVVMLETLKRVIGK